MPLIIFLILRKSTVLFFLIELIWARAMTVSIVYHLISDGKWTSQEKLVNNFQL